MGTASMTPAGNFIHKLNENAASIPVQKYPIHVHWKSDVQRFADARGDDGSGACFDAKIRCTSVRGNPRWHYGCSSRYGRCTVNEKGGGDSQTFICFCSHQSGA
jgi:hypothetical protein